jgi:hypothetical protein
MSNKIRRVLQKLAHSSSCYVFFTKFSKCFHTWVFEKNLPSLSILFLQKGTEKKRFPRYGVPIWSLWPNIRFLPSIVAEKNATKNEHIQNVCSMCIKINKVSKQEVGIWVYCFTSVLPSIQDIFRRIFLSNYWWQKSHIWSQASYRYSISKNVSPDMGYLY